MAPLKLLLTSYALSGVAAMALSLQSGGALAPILAFWLGGPVIVFALATLPGLRDAYRAPAEPAEDQRTALSEACAALDRLEQDRRADTPSPIAAPVRAGL